MLEQWKPVVGYEDCYSISDQGHLARTSTYGDNAKPCWKIRAPALKTGYRSYHMCKNGVRKYRLAHIMVWEAFKGPIPAGLEVNHENGDRDDPSLENLNLLTRSGNCAHSFRVLGRKNFNVPHRGSKHALAKLTETDIPTIFALSAGGHTQTQIAKTFGVSGVSIGCVLHRKTWRHVDIAPVVIS
jgi:hypothetical protein